MSVPARPALQTVSLVYAVVSMSEGSHKSISSLLRTSRHEKLTTPPSWPSARMRGASTSWPDSAPPSK